MLERTARAAEYDQYFGPPPELRELLRDVASVAAMVALAPGGDPTAGEPLVDDRYVDAAEALSALSGRRRRGRSAGGVESRLTSMSLGAMSDVGGS